MPRLVSFEHAEPTLAAEDADAAAAFVAGVSLDPLNQLQPARHAAASAERDHADLAEVGIDQRGRSSGLDRASVPGEPHQAAA